MTSTPSLHRSQAQLGTPASLCVRHTHTHTHFTFSHAYLFVHGHCNEPIGKRGEREALHTILAQTEKESVNQGVDGDGSNAFQTLAYSASKPTQRNKTWRTLAISSAASSPCPDKTTFPPGRRSSCNERTVDSFSAVLTVS